MRYEMDGNNISHIFVCPGIMKTTMKNVRPVMSLDAAHLKSKWKGILYTASVMTATSNMSESTNNMFDKAREMSWFNSLDYMLGRTMERISTLREEVKNKDGIVEHVVALLRRRWDMVAGYKVVQIREDGDEFSIIRPNQTDWETTTKHNIDVVNCRCSCGEWQEHSIPCVHAIVYFRLHETKTMDEVLARHVDELYENANQKAMLAVNIVPVCIETIQPDGVTLPPRQSSKRRTGRPQKKRIRKRSRWADDPTQSTIVCSNCKQRGHNIRTCDFRTEEAKKINIQNESEVSKLIELDLS